MPRLPRTGWAAIGVALGAAWAAAGMPATASLVSGLLLVAKTDQAHRRLQMAIQARRVRRVYAALVWGHLDEPSVLIEAPVMRHPQDRKRMAVMEGGRAARTDAFVVARFGVADLLRLELHTGRTHQIRVHLSAAGHPVVGDDLYGGPRHHGMKQPALRAALGPDHTLLHAWRLELPSPPLAAPLIVTAPWDGSFASAATVSGLPEGWLTPTDASAEPS